MKQKRQMAMKCSNYVSSFPLVVVVVVGTAVTVVLVATAVVVVVATVAVAACDPVNVGPVQFLCATVAIVVYF